MQSRPSKRCRSTLLHTGQSTVELLIIFPVLAMLVFGIIQFALLYQTRATLNHATLLVARAAALHGGDKNEMRKALATGLAPLFASSATQSGVDEAYSLSSKEAAPLFSKIEVLNPTKAALRDFGRPKLDGSSGRELPNDTLNYRSTSPGTASGLSVQDANILHIRVTYCARLIVPIIDRILYSMTNSPVLATQSSQGEGLSHPFGDTSAPLMPACVTSSVGGKRIQVKSEAFVRMQTPFLEANL